MANPAVYNALGYIGIAKQGAAAGTQGTATAATNFVPIVSESIKPVIQGTYRRNGTYQSNGYTVLNSYQHNGAFTFPLTSATGGLLLQAAMGGTDTVTNMADPYQHALVFSNQLPWLTFTRAFADQNYIEQIQDAKVNAITLAGKQADAVDMTCDFIGSYAPKLSMADTISYDAVDTPYMFRDATFAVNGVAAGSVYTVVGFNVKLSRNVKPYFTTHVYPDFLVPTARDIDVSLDVLWDTSNAQTWYAAINKNASTTTPSKKLYQGALTLTIDPGASPDHSIVLTMGRVDFTAASSPIDVGAGCSMMTMTGKAVANNSGIEMTATVKSAFVTAWSA